MVPSRWWFLAAALSLWAQIAPAQDTCAVCGARLTDHLYEWEDTYHKRVVLLCEPCLQITTRCVVCNIRVPDKNGLHLPDGRAYCAEDAATAVVSEAVARKLYAQAQREAIALLAHYHPVPEWNIGFHLVTREEFVRQYRRMPSLDDPLNLSGLTISRREQNTEWEHDVYVLHGLPRDRFLATCVHEYTHAWLNERSQPARQLHKDTTEGFCELVASLVARRLQLTAEQGRLLENQYTRGQIQAFCAAEREHGFHRLVQWMDRGIDSWIDVNHLDSVLALRDPETPEPRRLQWPAAVPPKPAPDTLVLQGFSTGARSFALINGATLAPGEQARVRVGATNCIVRCLAIANGAATVQVEGESQPRALRQH